MSLSQAIWQLGSFVPLGNSDVSWVFRTQVKEFLVFCLCDLGQKPCAGGQECNIYHIEGIGEEDQKDRLWKQTAWFNSELCDLRQASLRPSFLTSKTGLRIWL